jgi:hypothetical protein
MQVVGLSRETDLLRQVAIVFSDGIAALNCGAEPQEFLESAASRNWDVFFNDFDPLPEVFTNPLDVIKLLARTRGSSSRGHPNLLTGIRR